MRTYNSQHIEEQAMDKSRHFTTTPRSTLPIKTEASYDAVKSSELLSVKSEPEPYTPEKNKSKWLRRWWLENLTPVSSSPSCQYADQKPRHAKPESPDYDSYHEDSSDEEWLPADDDVDSGSQDDVVPVKSPRHLLAEALANYGSGREQWRAHRTQSTQAESRRPTSGTKRPSSSTIADDTTEESLASGVVHRPHKRVKREQPDESPVDKSMEEDEESGLGLKENVQKVLATAGVSPDSIIKLINNQEDRNAVIRETGFSNNYIMKLQRKVLRSAQALQLRQPDTYKIAEVDIHVLFDSNGTALFIKKELCELLCMKGTTFSYWKKKSDVEELDTSQDFRLMDQCRSIFGGRSTYTLYTVDATLAILTKMESSRQKGVFRAAALQQLIKLAVHYIDERSALEATSSPVSSIPSSPCHSTSASTPVSSIPSSPVSSLSAMSLSPPSSLTRPSMKMMEIAPSHPLDHFNPLLSPRSAMPSERC